MCCWAIHPPWPAAILLTNSRQKVLGTGSDRPASRVAKTFCAGLFLLLYATFPSPTRMIPRVIVFAPVYGLIPLVPLRFRCLVLLGWHKAVFLVFSRLPLVVRTSTVIKSQQRVPRFPPPPKAQHQHCCQRELVLLIFCNQLYAL